MKKRVISYILCACLSLVALFGSFGANTMRGNHAVGPQCDLPPTLVEQ